MTKNFSPAARAPVVTAVSIRRANATAIAVRTELLPIVVSHQLAGVKIPAHLVGQAACSSRLVLSIDQLCHEVEVPTRAVRELQRALDAVTLASDDPLSIDAHSCL